MLAPAKRTSAPRLSTFISAWSFCSRSLRRRSKSTRCCQSAPVWLYNRRGSFWCGLPRKLMSIPEAGSTLRSFHLTKSAIAHLSSVGSSKFEGLRGIFNHEGREEHENIYSFVSIVCFVVDYPAAAICLDCSACFALMALCTFSAVAGSEVIRTPTASWIALRIAAAVETHVGSPTPLAPKGPVGS